MVNEIPDRVEKVKVIAALREKRIRAARNSFYEYCRIVNPSFYSPQKMYLKELCDTLQGMYDGTLLNKHGKPYKKISINLPPGFGKSYTASLFSQWVLGKNIKNQIITISYNEKLAQSFSRTVRDEIGVPKLEPFSIDYPTLFPSVRIKQGDSSISRWSLEGNYMNYLATSPSGSLTGMRGNIAIIDDLVKSSYEAFNERILQEHWDWYADTFLSRVLEGGIQIVIQTRWSTADLTGRLIAKAPDDWYELKMPACLDEEKQEMLCSELLSWDRYSELKGITSEEIFNANYLQLPIEVKGKLYQNLQTYKDIPKENGKPLFEKIINYTDTADKGKDYLASITAGVYNGQLYVLDVYYTQDDMTITEKGLAEHLMMNRVNTAYIESNNGGSIYARNVERIMYDEYKNRHTGIETLNQSANKESRILSTSAYVQRNVFFPENWGELWTDFYIALNTYQKEFQNNKHDDAADALTGLCEMIEDGFNNQWKAVGSLY